MKRDFRFTRGTTFEESWVARKADGSIIDLTGASIAVNVGMCGLDFSLSVGDGVTVTDATAGTFKTAFTPAKTTDRSPGTYRHETEVTASDGSITLVRQGNLYLGGDLR